MQLTILSTKLPGQTDAEFEHEFRTVHAAATREMASSLGIISRYVQGISLHTQGETPQNVPLPIGSQHLQSFAQLTWPSTNVLNGSFKTSGYRNSAGKHIFATPAQVFLTEPLETPSASTNSANETKILLIMLLTPLSTQDEEFRKAWDEHSAKFRTKCGYYQRNLAMPLSSSEVEGILGGSQFPPELCQLRGGYEEFGFSSLEDARRFLSDHCEDLKRSYMLFCDATSHCMASDYVVQYSENDIGFRQKLVGTIVSNILVVKTLLGV